MFSTEKKPTILLIEGLVALRLYREQKSKSDHKK